ncbi:MAG: hypothetical protein U0797_00910 [Gemmataceae bacterium]
MAASVYDLMFGLTVDDYPQLGKQTVLFTGLHHEVSIAKNDMTPQIAQVGDGEGMFVFIPTSIPRSRRENELRKLLKGAPVAEGGPGIDAAGHRAISRVQQFTTQTEVYELLEVGDDRLAADADDRLAKARDRIARFQRNASAGDARAMAGLCLCYGKGLGTSKNPAEAYFWARRVSHSPSHAGLGRYLLGWCYAGKIGTPIKGPGSNELAARLYQESIDAGCPLGSYGLGLLLRGKPTTESRRQARQHFERAAGGGVGAAENELALGLLEDPACVEEDRKRGLGLLERAAARGSPLAGYNMFYYSSVGVPGCLPKDLKKARELLDQAVALGSRKGLVVLAEAHRDGPKGRLQFPVSDLHKAFECYDRAAQAGDTTALVESAVMLSVGRGVTQNHKLARERLEGAVKAGSMWADYTQGLWYFDGHVLPQSDGDALACFLRAADKGHPTGNYMAGAMYASGRGFKVRQRPGPKKADEVLFHADWHLTLHYLARAAQLGVTKSDPSLNEVLRKHLVGFNAALQEKEGEFELRYPAASDVKGNDLEKQFWFAFYTIAAPQIAREWKRLYPDSFAWYCGNSRIDPVSFRPLKDKGAKKKGEK